MHCAIQQLNELNSYRQILLGDLPISQYQSAVVSRLPEGIVPFLLDIMRPTSEHGKLLVQVTMQEWKKSDNGENDIGDEGSNHFGKCLSDTRRCQSIPFERLEQPTSNPMQPRERYLARQN